MCQAFKGVLPSDLVMKYSEPGGGYRMELDLAVACEIQDQIKEATDKAKNNKKAGSADARSAWEKRKQKREKHKNG